jgi:hypothetical protein
MNNRFLVLLVFLAFYISACDTSPDQTALSSETSLIDDGEPLFNKLSAENTGVIFNNLIDPNEVKSPIEYVNVYNGGGVATGDINNDGLADIYFTGNIADNKLYLNKGDFQFEDITEKAGVACKNSWSTSVTMTDVNNDGFLDIYVCRAYYEETAKRQNQLFINNGDLTFSEKSKEYGIGDIGFSIAATFFDYDKDGHADLYVGNHPVKRTTQTYAEHHEQWKAPKMETSDHLFHNNGDGTFEDVTIKSGVLNYAWTLAVVAADLNHDDLPDLFVSIDHNEPDCYYENNGDGTFSEVSEDRMKHISLFSMGVDAGDINNDGLVDLAVVEMLSTDNFNEKTKMPPMNPERFWYMVDIGYEYQYMRNMLHLNNGDGRFSEIGQMAGIQRTNWSWASLLADFDNDGWKDLYVANGYLREYHDKDHHNSFLKRLEDAGKVGTSKKTLIAGYGSTAPVNRVANNFFKNNGNLTFTEKGPEYGLDNLDYSSGAAYADLDNDGDLDLVVNHSNNLASIYKNRDREKNGNNYLRINLDHTTAVSPIGTKVTIETPAGKQFQEFTYTRGYQSSVEGIIHFGLGKVDKINTLTVQWMDGKEQIITSPKVNQILTLNHQNAALPTQNKNNTPPLFADITKSSTVDFKHQETIFDDYKKQVLLPHKMSQFGPFFTSGDVNRDGLEDFYVGGGNGQAGALYYQEKDGKFTKAEIPSFEADKHYEDMGAAFIDVNNDGFIDLYVASGGNEYDATNMEAYQDRLYINVGKGMLQKVKNALPPSNISSSCVKPFDFDNDGDQDLFIGGRQIPGRYPSPANSLLLENVNGKFVDATATKAAEFEELGMVTDAVWTDINADGLVDLLIVGEWMPLTVFTQENGGFTKKTAEFGFEGTEGWWNRVVQGDVDNDGDMDYVIGNLGWNYKYKASPEKPFHVFADDFDKNGTFDIALGYYLQDDVLYPVRGRQCSSEQIPELAEKFPTYTEFGKASIFEVYGEKLETAISYQINSFSSAILVNNGNGQFELKDLPSEAQIAPINGIVLNDFDGDSKLDLLIAGNLYVSEVETGRADAGKGLYLKGNGDGTFKPLPIAQSGILIEGDVKDLHLINTPIPTEKIILASKNNEPMQIIKWTNGLGQDLSSLK